MQRRPTVDQAVGIMLQGYAVTGKWAESMAAWMEGKGYKSVTKCRGAALPMIVKTADVPREPENVKVAVGTKQLHAMESVCGAAFMMRSH